MRILYHHRTLGDGAEGIHVAAMVQAFRDLGHEVKVSAIIGEATNVSTPRTRLLGRLVRSTPRMAYECLEVGYSVAGRRSLLREIRSWRPDVLYERYMLFNLGGLWAARRSRIPLILEVNAPLAHERAAYERLSLKALARRTERHVCSNADVVLVVSTPLKEYLVEQGVPAGRVIVLPNGADPGTFRPDAETRARVRGRLGISDQTVVVGFTGILRPWHGLDLLLEAAARLDAGMDIKVLIVGDGPHRPALERLMSDRRLEQKTIITGRVPHHSIPEFVSAFDIAVSPKATFYASPMKIPEYMAAGVTVVAPRMSNIQDLVTEGQDGVLFQPDDVADLASALRLLVHDPLRRRRLADAARRAVIDGRTWRHNAERVLALAGQQLTGVPLGARGPAEGFKSVR